MLTSRLVKLKNYKYVHIPVDRSMHGVAEHRQSGRHRREEPPFALIFFRTTHFLTPELENNNYLIKIEKRETNPKSPIQ